MGELKKDKHGRDIELIFDEDDLSCEAKYEGKKLGVFQFAELDYEDSTILLLTHCHLEEQAGFTNCGIGTLIIKLVVETGYTVFTRSHDGIPRSDGSHLTGNAPIFVHSLYKKGLIKYLTHENEE